MDSFKLSIRAVDRVFFEGDCESLVVPAGTGMMGIYAHHSNLITSVIPGKLIMREPGGEDREAAVAHGILKIQDNHVTLLCEAVEFPEEIDEKRAIAARNEALEALLLKKSRQDYLMAEAELQRAMNRLRIKRGEEHL